MLSQVSPALVVYSLPVAHVSVFVPLGLMAGGCTPVSPFCPQSKGQIHKRETIREFGKAGVMNLRWLMYVSVSASTSQ